MIPPMAKQLSKSDSPRPKKSLGQNFLIHPAIAKRIVAAAGVKKGETVLEVGPGRGILTQALLAAGSRVVAVEADRGLLERLHERFHEEIAEGHLNIVHDDIRDYLKENPALPGGPYRVVANIPYYLTGELIRELLTREHQPSSLTLLVQKEVAERIARDPKESLLSLSVKAYGTPRYEFTVPRGAFLPAPNVDSAVLSVGDISRSNFGEAAEEARFFKLIHAGFAHKRKRLAKNLSDAGFGGLSLGENVRAEDVPLAEWLSFAKASGE
jgi:16S rRNA (adenine1518-N6/adenine1519-N6)-dimethyltransferase